MTAPIHRLSVLALLGLVLGTAASAGTGPDDDHTTIAGGDIHEACAELGAGQVWHYRFDASAALDFNIHYHEESAVEYPVRLEDVRAHADSFTAANAQTYCLMWTNLKDAPVELNFSADIGD